MSPAEEDANQNLLSEATITLEILTKKIEVKEAMLANLSDHIAKLSKVRISDEEDIAKRREDFEREKLKVAKDIKSQESKHEVLVGNTVQVKEELKLLNEAIAERKVYFKKQEDDISRVSADWNDQLANIRGEASKANSDKVNALEDIVRHEQERDMVDQKVVELEAKLLQLDDTYNSKAADYRDRLRKLDADENAKRREIEELQHRHQAHEQDIEDREKKLRIAEVTLLQLKQELAHKERRLHSDYDIIGKLYE